MSESRSRRGYRRATVLAATAAAGLLLTACSTNGPSGAGDGERTLTIIASGSQQTALEALIEEYEEANPGVTVTASFAPNQELQTSVRTQLAGGNAPDIVAVYPGNGSAMSMAQLAEAGMLEDLSDQEWTSTVPEGFQGAFTYEDGVYVYSPGASVLGVVYNTELFEQLGLEVPTTMSEFEAVAEQVKAAGVTPLALGTNTPWITQLIPYALVPGMVYSEDPDFGQQMIDGETTFVESGWLDAFSTYADWQARGFFNENPNGTTSDQMVQALGDGTAAMAVMVSATLEGYQDVMGEKLGYFPLPATDDEARNWIPGGTVVGLGVTTQAADPELAKDFIAFLGEEENIVEMATAMNSIPFAPSDELSPLLTPFAEYFDAGETAPFPDQTWPNAEVQPAMFAAIQEMLGGQTTPEGALAQMDEAFAQ
ncbi:extracellular solute-binding protein [Agromyces sp. G08B096]|uniref:Extracellular solute-binding protein n=1 Tax=Agromyces sp. G08B096 TaxID=3156399 RepID=A0AAU7W518_9MICO